LVTWVPEVKLQTKCKIKIREFPFDYQCCELRFYSRSHTVNQMEVLQYANKNTTNLTHLLENSEWNIYDTCAINTTYKTNSDLEWWVTSYVIRMKRNSTYYIYTLFFPVFVLGMLSLLVFWLPADSGEITTLGITILISVFVNFITLLDYTPESASEFPVIGIYYSFILIQISISILVSIIFAKFRFKTHNLPEMTDWIKKIFFLKKPQGSGARVKQVYKEIPNNNESDCNNKKLEDFDLSIIKSNNKIETMKQVYEILEMRFKTFIKERYQIKMNKKKLNDLQTIIRRIEMISRVISVLTLIVGPFFFFRQYIKEKLGLDNDERISICGC
jgi:hypothetical protein